MSQIRLPSRFVDDHLDRMTEYEGLVVITPVMETGRHIWISADDPGIPELVADAKHYTTKVNGSMLIDAPGLVASARQVLKILGVEA